MDSIFSKVDSSYYVRVYTISPEIFGKHITLYAECSENEERINGHRYWLDIYFSVEGYSVRDFIVGLSFGDGILDKGELDAEIDRWAAQAVLDNLQAQIEEYEAKELLWVHEVEEHEPEEEETPEG